MPKLALGAGLLLATVAVLPPLLIARSRGTTSASPRLYVFSEMFFQPKFKPQTTSSLFADGRAMRPPVAGTVARGELQADERIHQGIEPGGAANRKPGPGEKPEVVEPNWTTQVRVPVSLPLMERGRQQFNIFCATCHGRAGDGDGLVSQRAVRLQQGTWVPPTSLHAEPVRQQPVGKLFHTITHGIRKMPAYGQQIAVRDRWAIVLYVKALQRSQSGSLDDVPVEEQPKLRGTE
jgi:mono/diheme cytochrome c family protein